VLRLLHSAFIQGVLSSSIGTSRLFLWTVATESSCPRRLDSGTRLRHSLHTPVLRKLGFHLNGNSLFRHSTGSSLYSAIHSAFQGASPSIEHLRLLPVDQPSLPNRCPVGWTLRLPPLLLHPSLIKLDTTLERIFFLLPLHW
jgi:hypothetical protein